MHNGCVKNVYQSKEVIDKEIVGYEVINQLLSTFAEAVFNNFKGETSHYNTLILKVFPETLNIDQDTLYNNILAVCNFVSKLSDSNAILTYKKLKRSFI